MCDSKSVTRKNKDDITGVIFLIWKQERGVTSAVGKNSTMWTGICFDQDRCDCEETTKIILSKLYLVSMQFEWSVF